MNEFLQGLKSVCGRVKMRACLKLTDKTNAAVIITSNGTTV